MNVTKRITSPRNTTNLLLSSCITAALLAGCNNDRNTDASTSADTTPPTVTAVTPVDGTTAVARDTTVTATFDEDMFATTIDGSSFTLTGSSSVAGTVSFDALTNIATFTPSADLSVLTTYTATLSSSITDLTGNALATTSWSFTTSDGAWSTAELIETDNASWAASPQIAVDASGNAMAVWYQHDGTRSNIMANRYVPGSGWTGAELVENENSIYAGNPQMAIDGNGNALAVWHHGTDIYANRYVVGSGWGTEELIESGTGPANFPQIAADSSGNAMAVWKQWDGSEWNMMANRYVAGSGWGTEESIESSAGEADSPAIAFDASGNAMAIWRQRDGTRYDLWANRYVAGSGWGTAELIENSDAGDVDALSLAVDANSNGMAVWNQNDGTIGRIFANRYLAGSGWSTFEIIDGASMNGTARQQVAMDGSGNALAVWMEYDGTRWNIMASRYVVGSGWGTPELIENNNTSYAVAPQIAVQSNGNALAVWKHHDGTRYSTWANRYLVGSGWGTPELLESDNTGDTGDPQIGVYGNGSVMAVWQQSDGTRDNIWANRFE
jgi:hypothetical protein